MRLATLLLLAVALLPGQPSAPVAKTSAPALASASLATAAFSPQYSYSSLTLWKVDVSGAKANIPAALLWALAAAHKVGSIDPVVLAVLEAKVGKRTVWGLAQEGCTIASVGTAVGAYIKAQPSLNADPVAARIALGAVTVAGVCGVLVPTLTAQKDSPPSVGLIGTELTVGSTGSGSGMFWSLQSGDAFTAEIP